ncbi:MAG: hypothetical protein AAGF95_26900 [Chloroflexota bacterium]
MNISHKMASFNRFCLMFWNSLCCTWGSAWGAGMAVWGLGSVIVCVWQSDYIWPITMPSSPFHEYLRLITLGGIFVVVFGQCMGIIVMELLRQLPERVPSYRTRFMHVAWAQVPMNMYSMGNQFIFSVTPLFLLLVLPGILISIHPTLVILAIVPILWQRRIPVFLHEFARLTSACATEA